MEADKIVKYTKYLINALVMLWVFLLIMNMVDACSNEEQYHFGVNEYTSPYNWIYQSKQNYLIYGVISIVYLLGMLVAGWFKKHKIYFLLFAVYLIFILYSRTIID
ncbi:MAG: hypothetical protein H7331_04045 [Bacteroidia bacterium]|nr:hypothetical protein [Bacteroidia bacterium]